MEKSNLLPFLVGLLVMCASSKGCPQIVGREQWGARAPKSIQTMKTPTGHVFIHHTAGATCTASQCPGVLRQIQNDHMNNRNYVDLGYNFLVSSDGKIYQARGWNRVGGHTFGYNSKAIAISFIGNYQDVTPNAAMVNAARALIECGIKNGYLTKGVQIHGHRDAACTACPGNKLYNIIKTWPNFVAGRLPGYKC